MTWTCPMHMVRSYKIISCPALQRLPNHTNWEVSWSQFFIHDEKTTNFNIHYLIANSKEISTLILTNIRVSPNFWNHVWRNCYCFKLFGKFLISSKSFWFVQKYLQKLHQPIFEHEVHYPLSISLHVTKTILGHWAITKYSNHY